MDCDIFLNKKALFLEVMDRCGGNRTHAAQMLGVSIRTIRNWVHQFGESEERMENKNQVQKSDVSDVFDSREVVSTLSDLMKRVTDKECTAGTVNAACNCASQITQLLRVHLDVERLKKKFSS